VLYTAACGGHEASRYVGSVMDDSAADSASTLTLTIWPRTDSTFTGHAIVAQPVGRGGAASAWNEGTTLKLYSLSADGDTIVWTSTQSGAALGGTYEVIGGVFRGQGGTWRARLVSGPPASPETLRRAAQRVPLPPIDAVWPALVLVALVAACARWVRAAPVRPSDAVTDPLGVIDRSIGGWLIFFMFGQIVSVATLAYQLPHAIDQLDIGSWALGAAVMGMRGALVVEKLAMLLRIVAPLLGLWLIWNRSRFAPRFWLVYLVLVAAFLVLDHLAATWIHAQSEALVGPTRADEFVEAQPTASFTTLRLAVILLIWSMYWCRSERVRRRFGHAALDRTLPSPVAEVALAS
jgi:hypothetical protein